MSFKLESVQGTVSELETDLTSPGEHARENTVIPVVKESIAKIVEALDGYLSVSCSGNINPAPGETGDTVSILITSLSAPGSPTPASSAQTAPVESEYTPTPVAVAESTRPNEPEGHTAPPAGSSETAGLTAPPVAPTELEPVVETPAPEVAQETAPESIPEPPVITPAPETPAANENPAEAAPVAAEPELPVGEGPAPVVEPTPAADPAQSEITEPTEEYSEAA